MSTTYAIDVPEHVAMWPPYTTGLGYGGPELRPLTRGPRYVQGPGRGGELSYWHRIRSGVIHADGRITFQYWCGQQGHHGQSRYRRSDPEDNVCGTCVGRALGAGQDATPSDLPGLAFHPQGVDVPRKCPGPRMSLHEAVNARVGMCLACGSLQPIRATGGPYNPSEKLAEHAPEREPAGWCAFHAWSGLTRRPDGTLGCSCGWDGA